jgi:dihydroorotase
MIGVKNVLINGEEPGAIVFDGKLIHNVYKPGDILPSDVDWINGHYCEAYPAGIDMHVHDRWGETKREDPEHLEAACVAGGTATIVTMPNTIPPFDQANQTRKRLAGFNSINVLAWIAATRTNYKEREEAYHSFPRQIPGAKLMMASTNNPHTLVDDSLSQRHILEDNADLGCITTIHAEAEDLIKRNEKDYEQMYGRLLRQHHCKIRESPVEVEGIRRILNIHHDVGGRIHIAHVSTADGIKLILRAKDRGQNVTFETCPHYWTFNSSWVEAENGGFYKMNPALRSPEEQLIVLQHLCNGDVDVSATDHAPHPRDAKTSPLLSECSSGVPGVETNVALLYELKTRRMISTKRFIDLASANAAKILGLNKGELAAGYDADMILIDPIAKTKLDDAGVKSKCGWTPYAGMNVNKIVFVVIGGQVVAQNFVE